MDYRGTIIKKRLSEWEELSEEWLLMIDRFCRIMPNDAPYFYREESNVSTIAGAAWRCGWIALQEFEQIKKHAGIEKEGWQDLLIHTGKKKYGIEAKQSIPYLGNNTALTTIRTCIEDSYEAAKGLDSSKYHARMGLSFHVPNIHVTHQENTEKLIDKLLNETKLLKCDLIMWSFPEIARNIIARKENKKYPGIIVTANLVE